MQLVVSNWGFHRVPSFVVMRHKQFMKLSEVQGSMLISYLQVLGREYENTSYRDYMGVIFPYSLLRTSKFYWAVTPRTTHDPDLPALLISWNSVIWGRSTEEAFGPASVQGVYRLGPPSYLAHVLFPS